ncbi:hypothetical protein XELAEV_18039265mg [Xenopus laevis]|uniref:GIY-YIG domain-containing protein n=1 Tax=Xenopus laevis TaxID=8355 RepID=A0A974H7Q4_XENLA|nr:hypothetical protein XELAEV_18039265mg [Xenopus laevis]
MESLYTKIPHEDGIAAYQHFLEKKSYVHSTNSRTDQIYTDTQLSLGDAIYLQLMGSAMLSKMAPQYANLLAQLEENFLVSCNTRPLTCLRYIDDIRIIWTASETELLACHQRFNQFHPTINRTLTRTSTSWIQPSTSKMEPYKHISYKTFVNQGYHPQVIDDQIHRATQIPRDTLLEDRKHQDTRLKETYPELPLFSYRQPPNLRKMIVRNHYSCASSNVVYIITCTRRSTGGIYIGKTEQKLRTRMNHHRHKINTKSCDTPGGQHFYSQNHSLQDMKVLILKRNFKNEWERNIYEFKCMELFNSLRQGHNLGSGFMSHYVT